MWLHVCSVVNILTLKGNKRNLGSLNLLEAHVTKTQLKSNKLV